MAYGKTLARRFAALPLSMAAGEAALADETANMGDVYDAEDQMADALLRLRRNPQKWQDAT